MVALAQEPFQVIDALFRNPMVPGLIIISTRRDKIECTGGWDPSDIALICRGYGAGVLPWDLRPDGLEIWDQSKRKKWRRNMKSVGVSGSWVPPRHTGEVRVSSGAGHRCRDAGPPRLTTEVRSICFFLFLHIPGKLKPRKKWRPKRAIKRAILTTQPQSELFGPFHPKTIFSRVCHTES
jgi:hypothetical protein